ncbi:hypothetical protein LBMAG42_20770 [Deltaproteobacteria bacterium]|nr:hypothetical protein LBMAG42_20770 [Deltaproteobacteria bacterium]
MLLTVLHLALAGPPSAPCPAAGAPLSAAQLDAATAVITRLYAPYLQPDAPTPALNASAPWTSALRNHWDHALAGSPDEQGPPGFDPYIDGQDYRLTDLRLTARASACLGADVDAAFENFGTPTLIHYTLILSNGDWRVDDVFTDRWRLSVLLGAWGAVAAPLTGAPPPARP